LNDAGGGIDEAGFSRLPALNVRGIAGTTAAAVSARIGDARSTLFDGIISEDQREGPRPWCKKRSAGSGNGQEVGDISTVALMTNFKNHFPGST
jgi:hypothetical protein